MLFAEIDWTQVLTALAVGAPATLTALAALLATISNSTKITENTAITAKIEKQTNGHLQQKTAEVAALVVTKVAEKAAEGLINTATAAATAAATASVTATAATALSDRALLMSSAANSALTERLEEHKRRNDAQVALLLAEIEKLKSSISLNNGINS